MRVTRFSLRKLIPASQTLEELLYPTALNLEHLSRHCRCGPTRTAGPWIGITRVDGR